MAEEPDNRRRRRGSRCRHWPVIVHGARGVRHRFRAVPDHCGDHRWQRARLHCRVLGPQAPATVQLPARITSRVRPVRGPVGHAHGPPLSGAGQMAVWHFYVRPVGTFHFKRLGVCFFSVLKRTSYDSFLGVMYCVFVKNKKKIRK